MNRKITLSLIILFASLFFTQTHAQLAAPHEPPQSPEDRIALYQALLDLTNPWTVMCIAAHPDDEDGTSLIVMRRKYGAHTVSLFSTFGEGGQNAIGPELYEELGAIRARETMAAAEIQGSEPHFLGLKDFGYSKSADEAFKFWGHDEALRRMVLQIRKLRPDVIITNHSATSNDHGHHQATARLELEAFDAAADPKRFPEQLSNGVTVWQVQRLFVRARGNAAQNTNPQGAAEQIVTIDPNERDPIRDTVFAEEALRALQKHATQGPWPKTFAEFAARFRAFSGQSAAPGQLPLIRYRLAREAKGAEALPKDSHNFLDGLRLSEALAKGVESPTIDGKPLTDFIDQRDRVLQALLGAASSARESELHLKSMKSKLSHALAIVSGINVAIDPKDRVLVPGVMTEFAIQIFNNGSVTARSSLLSSDGQPSGPDSRPSQLRPGQVVRIVRRYVTPANASPSLPSAQHLYDGHFSGEHIKAVASIEIDGKTFTIPAETFIDVAPPVQIESIAPSPIVISPTTVDRPMNFTLQLSNHRNPPFMGTLSARGENLAVHLPPLASESIKFTLARGLPRETSEVQFSVAGSAVTSSRIPVTYADAHVAPNLSVGYIRGFDFSLSNALAALGVESKELSVDEVKTADLQKYTSIIVDNRVYESQPELIAANQKLLDYANAGGTLIVFYHKSDEWNPDERRKRPQLAPYKLVLGNERITDENAPITFLEADHPLLNVPNKLNQDDFKDWIQERGLYYPKEWDPQFHALLQSNDPGEAPLKGGLLVADYGRGHYIYTSMVWYRELRGGVPGAYRMLANMISYGRTEGKR
jgi:LmbE family N-acetylglucosaminyl deacetylase